MEAGSYLSFGGGHRGPIHRSRQLSSGSLPLLPKEALSECFVVQKVLLLLGGNDGSPVFKRVPPYGTRKGTGVYARIFEVTGDIEIPYLSQSAVQRCLQRFARYGSAAYFLGRLVEVVGDANRDQQDFVPAGKPVASSLSSLLRTEHKEDRGYSYYWPVNSSATGFMDAIRSLWRDWNFVLAATHRMFVASLHQEFSGVRLVPSGENDTMHLIQLRLEQGGCSPFIHVYRRHLMKYDHVKGQKTRDHGLHDFKLTLLSLEHHFRPFLEMLDAATNTVELLLEYTDRNSLSRNSLAGVATMILTLRARSCEHSQKSYMRDLWDFMLRHTVGPLDRTQVVNIQMQDNKVMSWACLGDPFLHLAPTQEDTSDHLHDEAIQSLEPKDTAVKYHGNLDNHVLKHIKDQVTEKRYGALGGLRSAPQSRYHLIPLLSYLNGICCLKFGDSLNPLYELITSRHKPLNYHNRVKELLQDGLIEHIHRGTDAILSELTVNELVALTDLFSYHMDTGAGSKSFSLELTRRLDGPLSFVNEDMMSKYNNIMAHLLDHEAFCHDVKKLVTLSCRSTGFLSGFYIPRASLPLLHIARSLGAYYRCVINNACKTLLSKLQACRNTAEVAKIHGGYLDFLLEALIVPSKGLGTGKNSGIASLFTDTIDLIRNCAAEFVRLLVQEIDTKPEEIRKVLEILKSEVKMLKAALNVACSLTRPDLPVFGRRERSMLSVAVKGRIDLNSNACKALSMLHSILS